ncbi:MAG TPA: TraB/GumN family protein [Arenimonas sp.]|uniref:TraB/GumN family protein n=1 Tax=Arenimonas sp. TaxID=1872635 RepID=UPI002D8063C8|nr:TraB/GumN family protein [Arenimonas sp.]HEU0153509.1 TraB/GumN family protein [Arenimonas sp.]
MTPRWLLPLLLACCAPVAAAPSDPAPSAAAADTLDADEAMPPDTVVLDTIVVSGAQPGPGLWKVSRDGRVLWVLGTLAPLPKRMAWNSRDVERRIAASGVLLLPPKVSVAAEGAALGGLFLVPSLLKARNNPDGELLQDVLPAADYARWQRLKAIYLGRDRGVEKRRPFLAAQELREKAFDRADLSWRDVVGREVRRAARRADVPVEQPEVSLVVEDAKAALKDFRASGIDDLACFRKTLDQVENDLDTLASRANAWAIGDLAALEALPYADNAKACTDALLGSGLAQRSGFSDLPARVEAAWLQAAEKALATHAESVAVLPMARVVGERGYLKALEARGYTVEAPS